VDFDDVNDIQRRMGHPFICSIYKVFDLKNYSFLYSIPDENVQEIKNRFVLFSLVLSVFVM
jgi:hypothetical protein